MNERSYYGIVFPEFWTGATGLELRARGGRDAQVLALYLASNRHANMIGLYQVRADDIRHETGVSYRALEKGFAICTDTKFAIYDAASAVVWVPQMARIRLSLHNGGGLDPDDKRVVAANRLYHALPMNPFLERFFEANRKALCLKSIRHVESSLVVPFTAHHKLSSFQGASKPLGSQKTGTSNQ